MKEKNPAFAFIARTNTGKSTMAATLTLNENVIISSKINETTESSPYIPRNTKLAIWDTPGFFEQKKMLKELKSDELWHSPLGSSRIEEFYKKYKEHNKSIEDEEKKYKFEIELLKPIVEHNAAIIYIIPGTLDYSEDIYVFKELEILSYTERPIYIFVNEKPLFLGEYLHEKSKENIQIWIDKLEIKYRVLRFNPIKSDYQNNMEIFDALRHFMNSWKNEIDNAKSAVQETYCEMIHSNVDNIVEYMKKVLTQEKSIIVKKGNFIPKAFQELRTEYQTQLSKIEKKTYLDVKKSWEHKKIPEINTMKINDVMSLDHLSIEDLVNHKVFEGMSMGAMIGLGIDVASMGATMGAGTALGGGTGAAIGKIKSIRTAINIDDSGRVKFINETIFMGGTYMPKSFDMFLFKRILAYSIEIGSRSHAYHEKINISEGIKKVDELIDKDESVKYQISKKHERYKNGEISTDIDEEYKKIILDILLKGITQNNIEMKILCET